MVLLGSVRTDAPVETPGFCLGNEKGCATSRVNGLLNGLLTICGLLKKGINASYTRLICCI